MAKVPRLGDLHRYLPKWWHRIEPKTVSMENFQPLPEPSSDEQDESRFQYFAEIALQDEPRARKRMRKAA